MRLLPALRILILALAPSAPASAMVIIVPSVDIGPTAPSSWSARPGNDPASCLAAAATTERDAALPPDLLGAIGRVESGRWDSAAGRLTPWPWTVNAEGRPRMFDSAEQAVAYVASLQARGVRSIDVGCFQVNLLYHPAAFASLAQGFDPATNAAYAAAFLGQLHQRSGSWEQAVADYHSRLPLEGALYRRRVLLNLTGQDDAALPRTPQPERADPPRDDVTILASTSAHRVTVIEPMVHQSVPLMQKRHMPRVFYP